MRPIKKLTQLNIDIIFKFLSPEYLKILISLLLNNFIKKNCDDIKKIKGNISKTTDGEFSKERYIG
jgi:hypothetical protein